MSAKLQISDHIDTMAEAVGGFDERILRQILCSVDSNAHLSQRQLSSELGIALGSVNWYIKRCMHKGLIKISRAPLRRYMYYLTPQGMEEKGRLVAQYLKWSLDFFRMGREESAAILARCAASGKIDILLAGDSDLAEIFIMSAVDTPVTIRAIYDDGHNKGGKRLRVPIIGDVPADMSSTTYILTDMSRPQATWESLRAAGVAARSIIVPQLLYFRPVEGKVQ